MPFRTDLCSARAQPQHHCPWRLPEFQARFKGRAEMLAYCKKNGIKVEASAKKPYSMDRNLLHISFESGVLEDPWAEPPRTCSNSALRLRMRLTRRNTWNWFLKRAYASWSMASASHRRTLCARSTNSAANTASARVDLVENRFVGMKSRGVYETPGGTILHFAHHQMETLTMDREVMHLRDSLIPKYSELVYYGFWFSPEREALQALVTESQKNVTGTVRLKLYKGNIITAGRKSPVSLYNPRVATMEADKGAYNQTDATGFIRLNALRLKVAAQVRDNKG